MAGNGICGTMSQFKFVFPEAGLQFSSSRWRKVFVFKDNNLRNAVYLEKLGEDNIIMSFRIDRQEIQVSEAKFGKHVRWCHSPDRFRRQQCLKIWNQLRVRQHYVFVERSELISPPRES